jgi:asparagine synthase (glutamine-hydrolysing)
MCGIFGLIASNINREKARKSLDTLAHRGPDQWGEYIDLNLYLGHRRLSILDLSDNGKQPMTDDSGDVVISVNGEIYNYLEIRKKLLDDFHFISNSDSEVILHGYKKWGIQGLLKRIDGMFAITIYDKSKQLLFLARDRVGIKPLFYSYQDEQFIWASELKAIACYLGDNLKTDKYALYDYLSYLYIPQPKTLYKNVYKLKPAHFLEFDLKEQTIRKQEYWSIDTNSIKISKEEAAEQLQFLIRKSVQEQLMSDVPVGFFLSGGIDSSIVVYEAAKINAQNKTFTIGFSDPEHDESAYAEMVAKICNTDHHHHQISEMEALDLLPRMKEWYDEPFADTSALPSYLVSKFAKKEVTVVLTGDGGDELFGGYLWYTKFLKYYRGKGPKELQNLLSDLRNKYRYRILGKIANRLFNYSLPSDALYIKLLGGMVHTEKSDYRKIYEIENDYDDNWVLRSLDFKAENLRKELQLHDFKTYLPDDILTKMDRVSMSVSLEARVPLLSKDLIEFAFSLPEEILYHNNLLKGLVKYAYNANLPKEILYRKKRGFNIPVHNWNEFYNDPSKNLTEVILHKIYS